MEPFAWYSDRVFNKFLPFDFCILHSVQQKNASQRTLCSKSLLWSQSFWPLCKVQSTTTQNHFYFHHQQKNNGIVLNQWFLLTIKKIWGEKYKAEQKWLTLAVARFFAAFPLIFWSISFFSILPARVSLLGYCGSFNYRAGKGALSK